MNPTQERWLPIDGYEGYYEVSDHGRVRSLDRTVQHSRYGALNRKGALLSTSPNSTGHYTVSLHRDGKASSRKVHRLVLEAFVGPCPDGMEACHWDDDKSNNSVSNLRWGTPSENVVDAVRNGVHRNSGKTHCRRGHAYDENNTYLTPQGWRRCQKCGRAAEKRYRASKGLRNG